MLYIEKIYSNQPIPAYTCCLRHATYDLRNTTFALRKLSGGPIIVTVGSNGKGL